MSKRTFTKRILAVALSIIVLLGVMPLTTSAASTTVPGAEGHILTDMVIGTFEGGYDSTIMVYVTPGVSDHIQYTIDDNIGWFAVPSHDDTKWYFAGWKTWYKGSHSGAGAITSDKANPEYDDDENYFMVSTSWHGGYYYPEGSMRVLKEDLWKGTYYLNAIYEPLITVNAGQGVSYSVSGATKRADHTYSVKYSNGLTIDYSTNEGYIVTGVSANYGTNYSDNGDVVSLTNIERPATVNINARLKQQKVNFDANGGSGTMTQQSYSYGEAQTLTENNFTKTGYTFTGWNTKADGTGTAYADKQSVSFAPVNDGDSITLYAQWTACTNHQWEDGECTECGTLCSHSGGTATCTEQATCSECGMKYGGLGNHKYVYTGSENIITETCENNCGHNKTATISAPAGELVYDGTEKKATVSYSDGWQGGELTVTYSDGGNINAGKVTASIEKGGVKASVDYTIDKINPNYIVPTGLTATYGQTLANIVLPEGWTWDDLTASVGDTGTNSFKAIFTPADTTNYNIVISDVDVTVDKAVITITVDNKTAKQYEGLPQFSFTATGLIQGETLITNPIISTQADMKSAGRFEIIATGADAGDNYTITYVPGTLTVEAHTEHSGGVATCTEKAICTLCNQPYGETLSHTYSTDWKQDGTNHWRECPCGAKAEVAVHSGGTATCAAKGVCTVCGINYGVVDANAHSWGGWVTNGDGTHTRTCQADTSHTETDNCTGGTATCENEAVCTACDQSYGELVAHTYENGKCTVCSEVNPNHVPETSSPQTGDDSNLWIWVVLLLVSGGAVITLTVVDKKRRTVANK